MQTLPPFWKESPEEDKDVEEGLVSAAKLRGSASAASAASARFSSEAFIAEDAVDTALHRQLKAQLFLVFPAVAPMCTSVVRLCEASGSAASAPSDSRDRCERFLRGSHFRAQSMSERSCSCSS